MNEEVDRGACGKRGILLAAIITLLAAGTSGARAEAAVLYDQMDAAGSEAMFSNDLVAGSEGNDSKAADDFTVPAGEGWEITQVDVVGAAFGALPSTMNVDIYANSGGLPGAALFSARAIPSAGQPDYSIPLSGAPQLGPGTYWIAIQQDGASASEPQRMWFWRNRAVQSGNPAAVLYAGCSAFPAWQVRYTCQADAVSPDQIFRLSGTVTSPPPPPPPPPPATLTRANALAAVRAALARRFNTWKVGHGKRIACQRRSAVRFRCQLEWEFRANRYYGFAIVFLQSGTVRTEIHVKREQLAN
jgi:hypothetical protein